MLCPLTLAGDDVTRLSLGRGKILSAHTALHECRRALSHLHTSAAYGRTADVVGHLASVKTDRGLAVDVDRLKLPPPGTAATLPLREYLEDPAVLAAYDDPATLERPAASPLYDPPAQDVGPRRASSRPAVDRASAAVDPFYLLTQDDDDDASFACADADAVPAGAAAWALPGVPFAGRPCHRVAPADERRFLEALDTAGMLAAVWDPSPGAEPDCGFFAVRKEFRDGVWWQRLILDRRRRNAFECYVPMPPCPHGTVLCDLLVDAGCELRVWCSDLPQFYYRMEVSAARAATNTFTDARRPADWLGLRAVQRLLADGDGPELSQGRIRFCLGTMAMGDRNATSFAQYGHRCLLERAGASTAATRLDYRGVLPSGAVHEDVYNDDRAVFAAVPARRGWRQSASAVEAQRLFDAGREACAAIGVPDVAAKRREAVRVQTVWGAEVQGRRCRVGAPRARRAALVAVTTLLATVRVATVELLQSVLGLWVDCLGYRRAAFAVCDATYRYVMRYRSDEADVVRALPGTVVSELLMLAALAPTLDSNVRAPVSRVVRVSDASPTGGAVVSARFPQHAVDDLWHWRTRPGRPCARLGASGMSRGDSALGEALQGLPTRSGAPEPRLRPDLEMRWKPGKGHPGHINVAEARTRRALWRQLTQSPSQHGQRHVVAYDSGVVCGAACRGRSAAAGRGLQRELKLTYPALIAADCYEAVHWVESELNVADWGSRQRALPVPSPARAWVHAWLRGRRDAWTRRLAHVEGWYDADADHSPPPVATDGEAKVPGPGGSASSSDDDGAPAPVRARGALRRARSAPARAAVVLRRRAQGQGRRPGRLDAAYAEAGHLVESRGLPPIALLADAGDGCSLLDRVLEEYVQGLWDSDKALYKAKDALHAVKFRHRVATGAMHGAWASVTAWQNLEPGTSRTPVAPRVCRALVALALLWGWADLALLILVGYEALLRPGELVGLRRRHLLFTSDLSVPGAPGEPGVYVVLRETKTSTTGGARFQSVLVEGGGVVALLRRHWGHRGGDEYLWPHAGSRAARAARVTALRYRFAALTDALGIPRGLLTPASLRAGGATALWRRTRDFGLVRWRGRWRSMASLENYIQELPSALLDAQLSVDAQRRVDALSAACASLLSR